MRLWHYSLLPYLDRQHLLSQHRECCALRGKGWGRRHATVDYVFKHSKVDLYAYHMLVMSQMMKQGYTVNEVWFNPRYCGKELGYDDSIMFEFSDCNFRYPEHDDAYLMFCIDLLERKGCDVSLMRKDFEVLCKQKDSI